MLISRNVRKQKVELLAFYRNKMADKLIELQNNNNYKKKSADLNQYIISLRDGLVNQIETIALAQSWNTTIKLECILMVYYTCYVVMLETRNSVWEYEYMAFSRRIGELWEPFCKLCFEYPIKNIHLYNPPLFTTVKDNQIKEFTDAINNLHLKTKEKSEILEKYNRLWSIITSGEIDLTSDLHFTDGKYFYVVDFKSGFGSNEKGNTNRLLMVGEVYQIMNNNFKCLIFVRSTENNHYLQTLNNSGIWSTFTGSDTYNKIKEFTGYNIENWITNNIKWLNDFNPDMKNHILKNDLQKYLIW